MKSFGEAEGAAGVARAATEKMGALGAAAGKLGEGAVENKEKER